MARSWTQLAKRAEFEGIKSLIDREVIPAFEAVPIDSADHSGGPKMLAQMMGWGTALFVVLFGFTFLVLPSGFIGEVLRFVLFIPLSLLAFAAVAWLNKRTLIDWLLRSQTRYIARSQALEKIARHIGVAYVPRPGGEHPVFEWLMKQDWLPADARAALDKMPQSDLSMTPAVEAAREARIMGRDPIVIGTAEQKAQIEAQARQVLRIEDGFHGERNGVAFDAFEWIEDVDDAPDDPHLIIVLTALRPFHGITELRARNLSWLVFRDQAEMKPVDLGPEAFRDQYRLRTNDQVEARALFDPAVIERLLAIAHDGPFRAVARGEYLVFDIEGENRFALLDPATGAWSDKSVRQGLTDLAETLDLVDAFAATFRVDR
ncbi:MAG: DUF3137 domain-containing protein [Pseudomonadota bacterium]